jgi:hypothetical protein
MLAALAGGNGSLGRPRRRRHLVVRSICSNPTRTRLLVKPAGPIAGGHQWTITGWEPRYQAFEGLCWWGPSFGDHGRFRIGMNDLDTLLADDGDAHVTYRRMA